jgi:hypothetical protein
VRVGSSATVDSIVICHPGSINLEQIKAIQASLVWSLFPSTFSQIESHRFLQLGPVQKVHGLCVYFSPVVRA